MFCSVFVTLKSIKQKLHKNLTTFKKNGLALLPFTYIITHHVWVLCPEYPDFLLFCQICEDVWLYNPPEWCHMPTSPCFTSRGQKSGKTVFRSTMWQLMVFSNQIQMALPVFTNCSQRAAPAKWASPNGSQYEPTLKPKCSPLGKTHLGPIWSPFSKPKNINKNNFAWLSPIRTHLKTQVNPSSAT